LILSARLCYNIIVETGGQTKMRVYLDNCCYNRPYDEQSQLRVIQETNAKMQIQTMIKNHELELVTSYVLNYENKRNHSLENRQLINDFMRANETYYIAESNADKAIQLAESIVATGIKSMDALHVACALLANCDYFITVDDRLLKYKTPNMLLVTPIEFIKGLEGKPNV